MKNNIIYILISCLILTGPQFKCTDEKAVSTEVIVEGNKKFAFDIYHSLKVDKGNIFYSPYSFYGLNNIAKMVVW